MIATVSFVPAVRPGAKYGDGSYKSSRRFLDVVVNGNSLWRSLGKPRDMVSVLCLDFAAAGEFAGSGQIVAQKRGRPAE
jgi:hypothetical protein